MKGTTLQVEDEELGIKRPGILMKYIYRIAKLSEIRQITVYKGCEGNLKSNLLLLSVENSESMVSNLQEKDADDLIL